MDFNHQLITDFFEAFKNKDFEKMSKCYFQEVQYFDPMFHFLNGNYVMLMWKHRYEHVENFSLNWHSIEDLGSGYYTVKYEISYAYINKKRIQLSVKSHIRIQNFLISEHSDAFSMHQFLKCTDGFIGELFGWNRFYQNKKKLLIRSFFLNEVNERN
ncbi:MAG: hypothetical protein NT127_02465 [Sphingobacteriales bacterium]|nr:hypothetical protein [Sphingobacteriales bacterium]